MVPAKIALSIREVKINKRNVELMNVKPTKLYKKMENARPVLTMKKFKVIKKVVLLYVLSHQTSRLIPRG